ncbi:hypothetical protein L861_02010 [Litchfieldella anticariensis FP35 = DSM 16096]|uniref:Phytanoyl-CoA dioxygenase n=1 Tax=Litchfieldella anticariensis (strain DSM 16096 / CECT 5854 / CIP 108499 / LMG 22089 / FP35) TaxID=1121939 RepID=S2KPS7_LITA3|nr:phytanoyl-CoA dioxygenase family protein [Halomonas anticariensis]EPC04107.1 hypothetical protein L861_02010 [Halomonas anticariensis FP35 = DSM 16096]
MMLVDFLKEAWASTDYSYHKIFGHTKEEIVNLIQKYGAVSQSKALGNDECKIIREAIDDHIGNNTHHNTRVWQDEVCSDSRIYGFEAVYPDVLKLVDYKRFVELGEKYLGKKIDSFFILAARLDYKEGNIGSGGGWHRDSPFRHQFKSIVYLNDVDVVNGPFEYLIGSHLSSHKLSNFGLSSLRKMRFDEDELKGFSDRKLFSGKEGDAILVDTRGIHRGNPIASGTRYALTFYFWTTAMPSHFDNVINGQGVKL